MVYYYRRDNKDKKRDSIFCILLLFCFGCFRYCCCCYYLSIYGFSCWHPCWGLVLALKLLHETKGDPHFHRLQILRENQILMQNHLENYSSNFVC